MRDDIRCFLASSNRIMAGEHGETQLSTVFTIDIDDCLMTEIRSCEKVVYTFRIQKIVGVSIRADY